jgi:hypothetical protein
MKKPYLGYYRCTKALFRNNIQFVKGDIYVLMNDGLYYFDIQNRLSVYVDEDILSEHFKLAEVFNYSNFNDKLNERTI